MHIHIYVYIHKYTYIYICIHTKQTNEQKLGCESSSDRTDLPTGWQMTNSPGHAVPLCSSTLAYQAAHSSAFKAPAAICHVYSMKSYGAMAPGSTWPSAVEKHMRTGRRMKGFRLGSSSALCHHRPYLPGALTHANSRSSSVGPRPPARQLPLVSQYFLFCQ